MLIELIKASHASFNWIGVELDSKQPVQSKNQIQSITSNYTFTRSFRVILNAMLLFIYTQESI